MRAAFCTVWNAERDGVSDYSSNLTGHLVKAGVEIDVLPLAAYVGRRSYYRELAERANRSDLCHVQFNYPHFNGGLPWRNRFLDFALRLEVPLVLTAHEVRVRRPPWGAGFGFGVRLAHNAALPMLNAWSRRLHRRIYGTAAVIIAHTAEHAAEMRNHVDRPEKVTVVPHGIPEPSPAYRGLGSAEAKRRLGIQGKTVLATFGFINRRKGYESVLGAMGRLPEEVVFLIAGGAMTGDARDAAYYRSLVDEIALGRLGERVRITGYLNGEEVACAMAATDVALAPFATTAGSGALSTLIAHHKPIVASDISVHREINQRIPCLDLFREGGNDDLADRVLSVLASEARRKELASQAAHYADRYSFARIALETARIYDGVLAGAKRGAM